jgi:DNA polymerase III subunit epsilon
MKSTKLCFLDCETTGIDVKKNALIQVAGVMCEIDKDGKLVELGRVDLRMAPFASDIIDDEALKINGVKREEFQGLGRYAIDARTQCTVFIDFLAKYIDKYDKLDKAFLVGYNAMFDYNFLRQWFEKCGDKYFGSWFWFPPLDAMNMAALYLLEYRKVIPNFKLATVAETLGCTVPGSLHDAWTDIKITQEIFSKLFNQVK